MMSKRRPPRMTNYVSLWRKHVDQVWLEDLLSWINSMQSVSKAQIKNELKFWVNEYISQFQVGIETPVELNSMQMTCH